MNIRTITFAGSILAISLGWLTGSALGAYSPAEAIDLCNIESPWHMGPGANTVYDYDDGDDEENYWYGEGGNDYLRSLACKDWAVHGGADNDNVGGGSDEDYPNGGAGNDYVYGGAGWDFLRGDSGRDRLYDAETGGDDLLWGEGHDDYLVDGRDSDGRDEVDGGAGTDNCEWDAGDSHPDCET